MQFVNGMNTSYVQIRNELASEQLIKVQFQVAMSGRYMSLKPLFDHVAVESAHRSRWNRRLKIQKFRALFCIMFNFPVLQRK